MSRTADQRFLNFCFDREFHLPLGVVEFTLLADQFRLCGLRLRQFTVAVLKHLLQVCHFLRLLIEIIRQYHPSVLAFLCSYLFSLGFEFCENLLVDGLLFFKKRGLLFADRGLPVLQNPILSGRSPFRYCCRVASMSGAASDSFSLISVLQLGQVIVGSFIYFKSPIKRTKSEIE